MMLRFSKKKLIVSFWLILTLCYAFYAEYLIYKLNSKNWFSLLCKNQKECTKILLVADPQIIGNQNEIFHPITPLSIFDSDRYLKITYYFAYEFVKPDVVLFLGDLMDEGHIATDDDFSGYVQRLFYIFLYPYMPSLNVKHIWLPGDNDIGGEDTRVTPKKQQRFDRAFSQPSINVVKNITFFKINRLTSIIPVYKKDREFSDTNNIFIGLSHVPLMFRPSPFVQKVIDKMLPHVLFTAHEHKSMIINTDVLLHQDYHITPLTPNNVQVYQYTLGITDMYEIMIPTCSYRMGTKNLGYGSAVIENNELRFTILWSPQRFPYLAVYLILVIMPMTFYCFFKTYSCVLNSLKSKQRQFTYF